jgi:adenine phosphoribosyltransferase
MGEEASCNAASAMEAATNARPAKENGRAPAVAEVVAQEAAADPRLQGISDAIRVVPHFPKHGTTPFFTHSLLATPSPPNYAARQ